MYEKKRYGIACILLLVFLLIFVIPIPIPVNRNITGIVFQVNAVANAEPVQVHVEGTYWLHIVGADRFEGYLGISAEPITESETVTVQAVSSTNTWMSAGHLFYYSELGQGYLTMNHLNSWYFTPVSGELVITNGYSVQEEECRIIVGPTDSEETAKKILEKFRVR